MRHRRKLVLAMMHPEDPAQRTLVNAVAEFARATQFPLAFGGFETDGVAKISALYGNRTLSLLGLQVQNGLGLGGRVLDEIRPRITSNYAKSRNITHDYDNEVITEGVVTLFAIPVVLDGVVSAVLYGGTRGGYSPTMEQLKAGSEVAAELAKEVRMEAEVSRRVALRQHLLDQENFAASKSSQEVSALREELRLSHAELRRITADVNDPELRDKLLSLEKRLATLGSGVADSREGVPRVASVGGQGIERVEALVRLTPREIDVLAFVALGETNANIAHRLGLRESTVKSYLNTAMSKLDAPSRHAAVVAARRARLIP